MLPRTQQIVSRRAFLHAARRRVWSENVWPLDSATLDAHTRRAAALFECAADATSVSAHLAAQLRRLLAAVADDRVAASYGAVPRVDAAAGGVWLRGGAVPRGTLVASWPGVTFLPTDVMTIVHAGPDQFPELAWLWRLQQTAQTSRLRLDPSAQPPPPPPPRNESLITRSDGVVFDAAGCDAVFRFVNPFALAHKMRVAAGAANVVPLTLNLAIESSDERLLPFIGNVPYPFGVEEILSPADNSLNLTRDAERDPFQPLLLFVTTRDVAADDELVQDA